MMKPIRILGIAPYEGMKAMMSLISKEYPQIELTVYIGDLDKGVSIAADNFHGDYDVVISRGGTAQMLRKVLDLPVIEIEVSMSDILRAVNLAGGAKGRIALICYEGVETNARLLGELMNYNIDIYTTTPSGQIEDTMFRLTSGNYQAILCDTSADKAAKNLGLNSFLLTSGTESIRKAFEQALLLCSSQQTLHSENQFFRQLLQGQLNQTVVFDEDGNLFLSTLGGSMPELLELLRKELPDSSQEAERKIIRSIGSIIYSIRSQKLSLGERACTAFFISIRRTPLPANYTGISFKTRAEAEQQFYSSVFSYLGTARDFQEDVYRIGQSNTPVMVSGEDGTGKYPMVCYLFIQSTLQNNSLIVINCSLLNEKSWNFLLSHHNSPLTDEGNTLYFSNLDILTHQQQLQLLSVLQEMEVCRRNRVLFSCVCQPGEHVSEAGALFMDRLHSISLTLPPLRSMKQRIPTLVNLYLSRMNAEVPRQLTGFKPDAIALLQEFAWPHNYTQFRRVLHEMVVNSSHTIITCADVHAVLKKERYTAVFTQKSETSAEPLDLSAPLVKINRDIALRVVSELGGNQSAAAKQLGISRTTLWRLLQKET